MKPAYLDNAATTPVHPAVVKAMAEVMKKHYGNPSSPHALGEEALELVASAKSILACALGVKPETLVMTSGATEANALAMYGLAHAFPGKKKVIVSAFEHSSVWNIGQEMNKWGYQVVVVPVLKNGLIDMQKLADVITPDTLVVSLIYGHNELGVVQDIETIGKLCRAKGALFHTDAVQSFGKVPLDVQYVDLLSASAHKLGGPKGVGLLYIRQGVHIAPLFPGSQERGLRAGTENVPGIVGFGKAVEIIQKVKWKNVENLRKWFEKELEELEGVITCKNTSRLPGHVHVSFPGQDGEQLVVALSEKGIYCSTRSACLTRQKDDNRVLESIGMSQALQKGSVRFALSPETKKANLKYVIQTLKKIL